MKSADHTTSSSATKPVEPATQYDRVVGESKRPRLAIIHLLVLTACIALVLGLTRVFWLPGQGRPATATENVVWLVAGFLGGTAMSGAFLALARWAKLRAYPVHPGEWLWLAAGAAVFVTFLLLLPLAGPIVVSSNAVELKREVLLIAFFPGIGSHLALLVLAGARIAERHWRTVLLVCFFASLLQCGGSVVALPRYEVILESGMGSLLWVFPGLVRSSAVLVGALPEWRWEPERPWSHWAGVVLQFALDAFPILIVTTAAIARHSS
jgi:hypothetical protein